MKASDFRARLQSAKGQIVDAPDAENDPVLRQWRLAVGACVFAVLEDYTLGKLTTQVQEHEVEWMAEASRIMRPWGWNVVRANPETLPDGMNQFPERWRVWTVLTAGQRESMEAHAKEWEAQALQAPRTTITLPQRGLAPAIVFDVVRKVVLRAQLKEDDVDLMWGVREVHRDVLPELAGVTFRRRARR